MTGWRPAAPAAGLRMRGRRGEGVGTARRRELRWPRAPHSPTTAVLLQARSPRRSRACAGSAREPRRPRLLGAAMLNNRRTQVSRGVGRRLISLRLSNTLCVFQTNTLCVFQTQSALARGGNCAWRHPTNCVALGLKPAGLDSMHPRRSMECCFGCRLSLPSALPTFRQEWPR